ncbi:MAG TPA: fructose-bisphosphatase class III [Pyrinomonadaceae bacterium]
MSEQFDASEMTLLQALAAQYPTENLALAEAAALRASLSFPKGVVHVVSDVHGEYKKLRHIINNASGSLRPCVESLFEGEMTADELKQFLATVYYPHETVEHLRTSLVETGRRGEWVRRTLRRQFKVARALASNRRLEEIRALFPPERRQLFEELFFEPCTGRGEAYVDEMIHTLCRHDRDFSAVRAASRLVRNLSVAEIVVAGDLGDRGPRLDRVIDYLLQQPNVSFTWGNHDVLWMGACLGHDALMAIVLRVSLRYRRLSQLEEGYGITMQPLERLARTVYAEDPAERFQTKGVGLRDDLLMARMQKAIAVIQFKLEGQVIRRHPEWELEHRNLLHRIDAAAGTVEIQGQRHTLRDASLPTVNPEDPYALTDDEATCISRLRQSFVASSRLWQHMSFVARRGSMWVRRDHALIFHGCVPVDEEGAALALEVDGQTHSGRALFDALDLVVRRAFRKGSEATEEDKDWLWYLWTGPRSPLFGKDRMATFETYFVEDKATHKENKNPYFKLIHDPAFCARVAAEFGVSEQALIVNGHVPVRVEKGEEPVKSGGNAVTIDGAFSEAYGDRGYTLILAPERVALAEHHHFESVSDAITEGADIVPKVTTLRAYDPPRRVGDTEEGEHIRHTVAALERLVTAYERGLLLEETDRPR